MTGDSLEAAMVEWLTPDTVYEFDHLRMLLRDRGSLEALEHLGSLLVHAAREQRNQWSELEALRARLKDTEATIAELRRMGEDQVGVMAELVREAAEMDQAFDRIERHGR